MKRLAIILALVSTSVFADGPGGFRYREWHHDYRPGNDWVAPLILGGVIGYELNRPRYEVAPPVIVQQPQVVLPAPPYGYHYTQMINPACNCYQYVLVPN